MHELPFTSTALLRTHLRNPVLRSLERDIGSTHNFMHRLSYDVVSAALASTKFTPLEEGSLCAAAGEAIWTRNIARSKGYTFPEDSEKVRSSFGSASHRIWTCPVRDERRRELAPDENVHGAVAFAPH
eukprot:793546-Pyramimonas_sp.AAC.2